jgi:FKBP-type peptidyl-prolyl cis-trans isomerase FklB
MLSNHSYPADGNTRVTRTAAGILGVAKGRLITAKPDEYAALGVFDPLDHEPTVKSGFGRRVTLTDASGAIALDVVVGNSVENARGLAYVREAGKAEVYTAKVDSDLSTKFTDYVELDPFKINRDNVRGVAVVEYQLDPDKGTITPGPVTKISRTSTDGDWQSQQAPADKRPAKSPIDDVLGALTGLRLQGVRPFNVRWLQTRGFYLANEPQLFQLPNALTVQIQDKPFALFGTEGRLDVTSKDGLRYSFMFGKVALGDDQDKEEEPKTPEKKDDKPAEGANRYLAVFVTYDAALDEDAKAEAEKKDDKDKKEEKPKKKPSGKDRAAKAQDRFQRFFYVISDADFKRLRPDLAKLWEDKPKEPMAGGTGKTVKQWLVDNGALPGISTTPSGLQYQILASGPADGIQPTVNDRVTVAYKGTLIDGTEFDANQDTEFAVTGVIKAWTEALQLMRPGDQWKLFVSPELGYGTGGSPPKIGPNEILIFEVTLKSVVGKPSIPIKEPETPPGPPTP